MLKIAFKDIEFDKIFIKENQKVNKFYYVDPGRLKLNEEE